MIGKILGNRYRILREVGSGGMAWVYLAEDINEGRLVAAKVLYPQFSEDLAYIQRFNREAKLASTLSDQHIVSVLDYGATRDVHYLVMEYIEGQDLRGVIDKHGRLSWREALQFLDQVAMALEHAHLHGIVHRDIKPQNLMVTSDGVLKVLDFGIARARMLPSLTQSGFVGSPYYISPEQAMGEDVDIRSDIYSSGVVLYEMLSGRVPFDAASPWSIISQHIASEPPRIDLRDKDIPEFSEMLISRMIAKRPEDRFQTPTAMRAALACLLEGRPLPEALDMQSIAVPDPAATAQGLYQRALQAIEEEDWQRAVDLLNQVIKLDPKRKEASERLAHAGRQARLAALYAAARRAMEGGRWQEAVDELTEVLSVEPQYRDAADLLDRAHTAQRHEKVAQSVSDLYERGAAHIESGEWQEAAACLGQVQQLSPGYKQTQALLAEAEAHLRPGPVRLLGQSGVLRRVGLPLLFALFLIAVLSGVYLFLQKGRSAISPELATRVSEDPTQVFADAQQAFQADDWDRAIELLAAILATDPTSGQAQNLSCNAHLQRGRAQLDSYSGTSDRALVESAHKDFEAGLAICPNDEALSAEKSYAAHFLQALKAQQSEDTDRLVQELAPIITAEPGYANGHARYMLYVGLVERGDIRQQDGNLVGAFEDYRRALALGEADLLDAASRRDDVLDELGGDLPSTTLQTVGTPTRTVLKYAAPTLIGPENDAIYRGEFTVVILRWEPVGQLAADEYYDVTIMHYVAGEPRYWGGPSMGTEWQVPVEAGLGEAANDRFHWWVTVRKADTAPGAGQLDLALSPRSDSRSFVWAE